MSAAHAGAASCTEVDKQSARLAERLRGSVAMVEGRSRTAGQMNCVNSVSTGRLCRASEIRAVHRRRLRDTVLQAVESQLCAELETSAAQLRSEVVEEQLRADIATAGAI